MTMRRSRPANCRPSKSFSKPADRNGTAIVEMAVCLPLFLMVLMGIMEFGRALSVAQLLNGAAREGCREAIIEGTTTAEVQTLVRDQVVNTVGCSPQAVIVTVTVDGESDVVNADPRDLVTVRVTVAHSAVSYSLARWLEGKTLRGVCAMRHE